MWTLPISDVPFGDVDAVAHFSLADYQGITDKPLVELPFYLDKAYGWAFNHKMWYAPTYHTTLSLSQIFGGHRFIPIYLMIAIFSSCIVITSYFLIRKLYGFWPAFLSSLLLTFSLRDILIYIWGRWPQTTSFFYVPLILYCYYQYTESFLNKHKEHEKEKPIYLFILALLLVVQFTLHPQGFLYSVAIIIIYTIALIIKEKKLPFNIKHGIFAAIVALILVIPFAASALSVGGHHGLTPNKIEGLWKLFRFYPAASEWPGSFPPSYFDYDHMHGGYWTIPFLIIGLLFLILRRKRQDLLMMSWLFSLYLFLHLDIIGVKQRVAIMMGADAHILYPIIAIGIIAIPSLLKSFKIPITIRTLCKYGLIVLFLILAISINGKVAHNQLQNAYPSYTRINPPQFEAVEWARHNLPEDSVILNIGTPPQTYNVKKWIMFLSHRFNLYDHSLVALNHEEINTTTHYFFDYSIWLAILNQNNQDTNAQQAVMQMQQIENSIKNQSQVVYDKNAIKVYQLG